jgi:hypothetical protein
VAKNLAANEGMVFVYWIFSGKLREGEGYH